MKKSIALTIMLTLGAFLNGNAAGKESWKRTTLSNLNLRGTQAIQARAFLSYELDREAYNSCSAMHLKNLLFRTELLLS